MFEDMPPGIAALDRIKGYPIPWFVAASEGRPIDFRVVDQVKLLQAVRDRLCWICGQPMDERLAFVGGPLSAAQLMYADPPSHIECAEFALRVCPFLSCPNSQRREQNLPEHMAITNVTAANPEVFCLVVASNSVLTGSFIRAIGPAKYRWYTEGRLAKRREIKAAMELAKEQLKNHPRATIIQKALRELPVPSF